MKLLFLLLLTSMSFAHSTDVQDSIHENEYHFEFSTYPEKLVSGKNANLIFYISLEDGSDVSGTRKLTIYNSDMTILKQFDPESGNGQFSYSNEFNPGNYIAEIEFEDSKASFVFGVNEAPVNIGIIYAISVITILIILLFIFRKKVFK